VLVLPRISKAKASTRSYSALILVLVTLGTCRLLPSRIVLTQYNLLRSWTLPLCNASALEGAPFRVSSSLPWLSACSSFEHACMFSHFPLSMPPYITGPWLNPKLPPNFTGALHVISVHPCDIRGFCTNLESAEGGSPTSYQAKVVNRYQRCKQNPAVQRTTQVNPPALGNRAPAARSQ
jgi:hypothetical protein